jgi:hypothetical protein
MEFGLGFAKKKLERKKFYEFESVMCKNGECVK